MRISLSHWMIMDRVNHSIDQPVVEISLLIILHPSIEEYIWLG